MAQVNERNNTLQKRQERLTFKAFIEGRWAAYVVKSEMQESTQEVNNSMIRKHLLPFFGDMVMSEITPADVTRFLTPFYKTSYAKNLYLMLSSIFSVADQRADDSTTKAHYIHISQESGSRVLEAVANRILSHCDTTFSQESAAVN